MAARAPAAQPAQPGTAPAAVQPQADAEEDKFASPPGLWLPRMVVREHRRKATFIWVTLLVAFVAYIYYIVSETVKSRQDPAVSIALTHEPFKFPDVAICPTFLNGCLESNACLLLAPYLFALDGFEDDLETFMDDNAEAASGFMEAYPGCKAVPLSRATINQTAVDNGDITSFHASFLSLWDEGEWLEQFQYSNINNQHVTLHFVNLDKPEEYAGGPALTENAKIPYSRISLEDGAQFATLSNHMVITLTEFTGIDGNGKKTEKQRTYSQSTTTSHQNWLWEMDSTTSDSTTSFEYACLVVELAITKFEYTSFEQVDPVDVWAILGAIGGIWQFVVTGFWLFFVFSEKQVPDRKIRNFRKSVAKPFDEGKKRLSMMSSTQSRQSNTDTVIDASDEDLPEEWVKKRRPNGSIYYYNALTGVSQDRSPNDFNSAAGGAQQQSALQRVWRPYNPAGEAPGSADPLGASHSSGGRASWDDSLPPGWVFRTDSNGKPYYMNTIDKTTQWERPTQRDRGGRPQSIDAPMARRGSNASSVHSHSHHSAASSGGASHHRPAAAAAPSVVATAPALGSVPKAPSYNTAVFLSNSSAAAGLPPNWQKRTTDDGKTYYANTATKETRWEAPKS